MMYRIHTAGLVLMSIFSIVVYSMEESPEVQLIERKIKYNDYLCAVEKGLYVNEYVYSDMVRLLRSDTRELNGLIEEIDHLVNSYRNQSPVLMRFSGRPQERSINSPDELQKMIKAKIEYRHNRINRQKNK